MRKTRLLGDRQRIHVGAQADATPGLLPWRSVADHAGAGNPFVHLETEQAQRRRNDAGGAAFLESEFRMRVQVATQRDEVGHQVVDRCRGGGSTG